MKLKYRDVHKWIYKENYSCLYIPIDAVRHTKWKRLHIFSFISDNIIPDGF